MPNVLVRLSAVAVVFLCVQISAAQEIQLEGGFLEDSLKIGENIHYWLRVDYPSTNELVLPDTNFSFTPFEFSGKDYFTSLLKNERIVDSAVYTLQSYEIDPVQYLALPAFLIKPTGDSVRLIAHPDSIYLFELVPVVSDTTTLKSNLGYQNVYQAINYPLWWIVIGTLLLIAAVVFMVFGNKFRRTLKLRRLRKDYRVFSDLLTQRIHQLQKGPDRKLAESTLSEWKRFLERLEQKPFSKLTTKEIMSMEDTAELKGSLKNIDRCVYGGIDDNALFKDFQELEDFTAHRYTLITNQIKHT